MTTETINVEPQIRLRVRDDEHCLAIVEEDLAEALLLLGNREWLGTLTIRLKRPLVGRGMFAGCCTNSLLVEVDARTVSLSVILDYPVTFTYSRLEFSRYLRHAMKELSKARRSKP
ncbi:hypothetical protein [Salmonella enterica]|uniref:hypothetical protein n=1 Tax=Salmonella enterica TaxID=28901 RepID=UPI0010FB2665|nr:hypothetical protein [Salmonella enterica]EED6471960.1 hypothetical protein [Salmonella enterica subsp. enterica serovar Derby]EEG8191004.1 hypothetical protein [Salmonella enterica]MDR5247004.1 hypothetical protein [Salmonella enterica subsp. enterica serovar Typhimurium]TLA35661.1 hypothetical protein E2E58_21470 [Salmonella enterica subsp. enterica serovar Newport]